MKLGLLSETALKKNRRYNPSNTSSKSWMPNYTAVFVRVPSCVQHLYEIPLLAIYSVELLQIIEQMSVPKICLIELCPPIVFGIAKLTGN